MTMTISFGHYYLLGLKSRSLSSQAFERQPVGLMCTPVPLAQLSLRLRAELHHLHPAANHKQIEVFPRRRILCSQAIICTEDKEAKYWVKAAPLPISRGQFARLEALVPARADTVVARNVVWACDNISQTTKHWKQTDEATYCIDLVIWQIALEWVSTSSRS